MAEILNRSKPGNPYHLTIYARHSRFEHIQMKQFLACYSSYLVLRISRTDLLTLFRHADGQVQYSERALIMATAGTDIE